MENNDKRAWIGVLIVVLVAAGLAWAGSQGSAKAFGWPIFGLSVAIAFAIQWIAFIPAFIFQTEKFYDLIGSITYITVVILAAVLSPVRDARIWLLVSLVVIWAARLGSFLFMRIQKAGEDRRFREIKPSFPRFWLTWSLQGLWVSFSLSAALAAITTTLRVDLGLFAILGAAVWLFGFGLEVIADQQKSLFKADPANEGRFIRSGLWSWSRHPNYFGEIVLWIGVMIIALPVLRGWQWVALISPVFITLLLTRISGVPMLEKRADEKWGGQTDYEAYKANTSILIPVPPKK
ncbi:MAG: DUF1295 domain-containing protein [Anaerolineales bacterium]|jgi:steroid 5-alpha reductase family enzyme